MERLTVFVSEDMDEWLEDKVKNGDLGDNKSKLIRNILRDIKREVVDYPGL